MVPGSVKGKDMSESTKFRDVRIGQMFDFVAPSYVAVERGFGSSFYERCRKETARTYSFWCGITNQRLTSRVGSVEVEVWNVCDSPKASV